MKIIEIVTDIVCNTLLDPDLLEKARRRKGAFTRNCGKLPFWTVMKMLMSNVKRTVSSMLDEFFSKLRLQAGLSAEGIGGKTNWWFWPNAFMRECAGLLRNRIRQEIVLLAAMAGFFGLLSMALG